MRLAAAVAFTVFATTTAAAQPSMSSHDAMKRLSFLVGEWKGEGWNEYIPGQRGTAGIVEKVAFKANGTVLVVEGLGTAKLPSGKDTVVHSAFATIGYDAGANVYRMRSYLADGRSVDAEASFVGDAFQWRFEIPRFGKTRYTVKLNERGEWYEIGETSQDGTTWRRMHEMTLKRVGP